MNRRDFLLTAAALASLRSRSAYAEETRREPPYLALRKFIEPGFDEFPEEKLASDITAVLDAAVQSRSLPIPAPIAAKSYRPIAPDVAEAIFDSSANTSWSSWLDGLGVIRRSHFFPLPNNTIRFEIASARDGKLFHRTGLWKYSLNDGKLALLSPLEEHVATASHPFFRDVTASAFASSSVFDNQLSRGIPYWRSHLDPATGIDVYGANGVAVGDIDNDGSDEVYICQPGGLPNRLLKFGDDGTLADITAEWNAGILDDTSAALFVDLRNSGLQDLIVLRSGGPVLLINEGHRFTVRTDAFHFLTLPQGGFTGMAAADYDRDGKLDVYLCCYVYFQSEAQYTYAVPYYDARNGPPNFLFRNHLNSDGSGTFEDVTAASGLNENNDRFSFAPAWCDYNDDGWPDLYVANDFGRKNFYVNSNGHFRDRASELGADDIGPGMSASWFDYDHDGRPDLYVANMWTAAGQRVIHNPSFPGNAPETRDAYTRHTMGNTLLHDQPAGTFDDVTPQQHASFGRWAWAAGGHDLDNDGEAEIFVTCGMLTNESETDLASFFWRQVVAKSPLTAHSSAAYENGWNALNQFLREDFSWNGREPNVFHARRGNRYFDFSGVSGLDFADDSRAFAITDFDGDGRPDLILKSRLGPQVRVLQNDCAGDRNAIAFRLRGVASNRDAIGARIQVDHQTKWLAAGSEFLSQHSKRLLFGLGQAASAQQVRIKWPSGHVQEFTNLRAGHTYSIVEGNPHAEPQPFRVPSPLPAQPTSADNQLGLADTWFLEPIPLPEPQHGPGLLVLNLSPADRDRIEQYEIFRRYLFDWRAPLRSPLALLLNESGHAVKIYAAVPAAAQVKQDLAALATTPALDRATPFPGFYVGEPHRDFFKFGVAFLWSGYYEQALPYLESVLHRTPDNARVLVLVGQIHLQANRLDAAQKAFVAATELNPQYAQAWAGLADCYDARQDPKQAEACYRRVIALDPNSPDAINGLGLALAKQGHTDEARQNFERAIELRHNFSGAINNLGVLFVQQGKLSDAVAAFEYGIKVAPDEDILYLNLGRAYVQMGKLDRARELMQRLLGQKPGSAVAQHALQELNSR